MIFGYKTVESAPSLLGGRERNNAGLDCYAIHHASTLQREIWEEVCQLATCVVAAENNVAITLDEETLPEGLFFN